jgi:hypothetical protein
MVPVKRLWMALKPVSNGEPCATAATNYGDFHQRLCRNLQFQAQTETAYRAANLAMPRRYWQYPPEFQVLNLLSTAGSAHPRSRIPLAHGVFHLVFALQKSCRRESVGSFRSGMDDDVAAAADV